MLRAKLVPRAQNTAGRKVESLTGNPALALLSKPEVVSIKDGSGIRERLRGIVVPYSETSGGMLLLLPAVWDPSPWWGSQMDP